jgi:hypothetical protein
MGEFDPGFHGPPTIENLQAIKDLYHPTDGGIAERQLLIAVNQIVSGCAPVISLGCFSGTGVSDSLKRAGN